MQYEAGCDKYGLTSLTEYSYAFIERYHLISDFGHLSKLNYITTIGKEPYTISLMIREGRNIILKRLREEEGFSFRQKETVTGIYRRVISRVN